MTTRLQVQSLCATCNWGYFLFQDKLTNLPRFMCQVGNYPSHKKRVCKFYWERKSDGGNTNHG